MFDDPIDREADGLLAGRVDIERVLERAETTRESVHLIAEQVGIRDIVIGSPGIVHRSRRMPQVACMHGRTGEVVANCLEQDLVPLPRDRGVAGIRRRFRDQRPRAAVRAAAGGDQHGGTRHR